MNAARTVSAILNEPWLISRDYVLNSLPLVMNIIEGKHPAFAEESEKPKLDIVAQNFVTGGYYRSDKDRLREAPRGSIAKILINHPITRHNNCGDIGSMSLAALVEEIDTYDNIEAILFEINSPGGMVSGTQHAAQAIANVSKPTATYIIDGIAASAAYWLASQTDKIYVSNATSAVGSIGAYITFLDIRGYLEENNVKLHEVFSRYSTDKNKTFRDARDGDYAAMQDELDTIVNAFVDAVKRKRSINMDAGDPFTGKMFKAEEAIAIGLIDGIATIDKVMDELIEMANENSKGYYV
jgi:ClpP class serine protease